MVGRKNRKGEKMLELQKFLFETEPSRKELINYIPSKENPCYQIQVYRNHSFELVEHTIFPYLDYAGINVQFLYSDYDDSLSFFQLESSSDLLILWLDLERYKENKREEFIEERLTVLRSIYQKPILCIPFGEKKAGSYTNVICYHLDGVKEKLKKAYLDERLEKWSGTKLSAESCKMIAKELGLKYIPALLKPLLKAIVVDLDYTLYRGVLGEDGMEHIEISEDYLFLQRQLKLLAEQGFFLCMATKNEEKDVWELLEKREDFLLKKEVWSVICASWEEKADMIQTIADFLNIHTESILFIDDNIGEILSVLSRYPRIHVIHAHENPKITSEMLAFYPGLMKLYQQKEDQIRSADIKAKSERLKMKQGLSKEEYIRSLDIRLTYKCNCLENASRISELANKTNQFIFSYKRYHISEIVDLMQRADSLVLSIFLQDKLSDSGLIGSCLIKKEWDRLVVEECFVSCRALGRGIEEVIVLGAIYIAQQYFNIQKVKILFCKGERNKAAEKFLEDYAKENINQEKEIDYKLPRDQITIKIEGGIEI